MIPAERISACSPSLAVPPVQPGAGSVAPPASSVTLVAVCIEGSKIVEVEVEWVDRTPPGFDHEVADAFAEFARHYRDIAAELFDDDPDLTSRIALRESRVL